MGYVAERVAWWARVFEVPCVGFAASLEEVEPLAAAGADFVAVGDCVFGDARGGATVASGCNALPSHCQMRTRPSKWVDATMPFASLATTA